MNDIVIARLTQRTGETSIPTFYCRELRVKWEHSEEAIRNFYSRREILKQVADDEQGRWPRASAHEGAAMHDRVHVRAAGPNREEVGTAPRGHGAVRGAARWFAQTED